MNNRSGFTLIELLIVTAIIGLLASLAYPGYASYMASARRMEGQSALLELMLQQERYYAQHNRYLAFSAGQGEAEEAHFRWWSGSTAAASAYELSARACPGLPLGSCVELRAVPGTAKVDASFRDRACETLTLTSGGQPGATGPRKRCWP